MTLRPNKTILRQVKRTDEFKPDKKFIAENRIGVDVTYIINGPEWKPFITEKEINDLAPIIGDKFRQLKNGEGDCRDGNTPMLGWMNIPDEIEKGQLDCIVKTARGFSSKIDAYVSLGIGGSYLGIEATFRTLAHTHFNQLPRSKRGGAPKIYFLGQNLDPDYFRDTLDMLERKRVGINVISKSGTTLETAIAFRIMRQYLEKKEKAKASKFVIATTDKAKGALRKLAEKMGYATFVVPENIGGRFSILSDVGLVGLAVAGIDIHQFVAGFREMKRRCESEKIWENPALMHAAVRYLAHKKGKRVEVVATNSAAVYQLLRWMEQLFPESEGHKGYGMWVSPSLYSEKLHANGQMVQDGERNILETFIKLEESDNRVEIPKDKDNLDGLNYLPESGKDMNFLNGLVIEGPAFAHFKGGVPNMTISLPRRNAFNIGQFYYMMELSVALSGYLAGHNPFIQPGVEAYKKAIFALAGKPGTEKDGSLLVEMRGMERKTI